MNRVLTFIGLITCIIGLCYGINYIFQNYSSFTTNFFYYFGMVAFIDIIILIALRLYYGDNWIVESGKDTLIGSDIISAINQTLND